MCRQPLDTVEQLKKHLRVEHEVVKYRLDLVASLSTLSTPEEKRLVEEGRIRIASMQDSSLCRKEGDLFSDPSHAAPKIPDIKTETEGQELAREIAEINKNLMDNSHDIREEKKDYASSQASHMRAQLKEHNGEESKKCNQCDYASPHTGTLKRHIKAHNGEKSNKCNMCNYSCSRAVHLRAHLKTHSGEKSMKCSQCDYATPHRGILRRHIKAHSIGRKKHDPSQADNLRDH